MDVNYDDQDIEDLVLECDTESVESSEDSDTDSDNDEGEIGEIDEEVGESDEDERAVDGQPLPYQDEPPPRNPAVAARVPAIEGVDAAAENLRNRLDPANVDNWCQCGRCEVLPSFKATDCICCRLIPEAENEADENNVKCITDAQDFEPAILNPLSLYIAWLRYTEKWRRDAINFRARNNEKYRYVAYRQFVRWIWGFLGRRVRVQLPACVHARVMRAYPDAGNNYKGTILRPLNVR